MSQIPLPLIAVIAEKLAKHYSHTDLDMRFLRVDFDLTGVSGSNKVQRCHNGLRAINAASPKPLRDAGKLLEDLMEVVAEPFYGHEETRAALNKQLQYHGLTYVPGGNIVALGTTLTSTTLTQLIVTRDLIGVQSEFERIIKHLEEDPPAAVTAASSLLESLFKTFIVTENLRLPADESLLSVWKVIRQYLRLDPSEFDSEHLRRIASGIASTVDGIASLRTHSGSAHGRVVTGSPQRFRVAARHARLAAHSAMALAIFFIESADFRREQREAIT